MGEGGGQVGLEALAIVLESRFGFHGAFKLFLEAPKLAFEGSDDPKRAVAQLGLVERLAGQFQAGLFTVEELSANLNRQSTQGADLSNFTMVRRIAGR